MGTRLYPLPGGDEDEKKVWYSLDFGMGMGMNFLCGDGYGIAKPVPAPPRCHPYFFPTILFPFAWWKMELIPQQIRSYLSLLIPWWYIKGTQHYIFVHDKCQIYYYFFNGKEKSFLSTKLVCNFIFRFLTKFY